MRRASILVVLALSAALLAPAKSALAASRIELLNPSGYTMRQVISTKQDADSTYHLVAWVDSVPANPLVEFELQPTGENSITIDGRRVGSTDTWEANLAVPTNWLEGRPFVVRARLYSNLDEVDEDEATVEVNRNEIPPPPAANTVEITYPANGGALGFFRPTGKPTNAVIEGVASTETQQARALYTTSRPGTSPTWTSCGSGSVAATTRVVRARCNLASGTDPAQVTAVALVANDTPPPATPDPAADESGDAHRVFPYAQQPALLRVEPATVSVPGNELPECRLFTVRVTDQLDRPVAGANIDVHAVGPDDQLQFGVEFIVPGIARNSSYQPPDRSHSTATDPGANCSDNPQEVPRQGEHHIPGRPDVKHIESTTGNSNSDGTNNVGEFSFVLESGSTGPTTGEAWVDVNDDDVQGAFEISGGFRIGWGSEVPPAERAVFIDPVGPSARVGTCQRMVVVVKESGSPLAAVNVDVHISGPEASVSFCPVADSSAGARTPDTPHTDEADTYHLEAETDAAGRFIFGVLSPAPGNTQVLAWLDTTDDDIANNEPARVTQVSFEGTGERSVSIDSNRSRVSAGGRVTIFGEISGDPVCESGAQVKLKARRVGAGRFRTVSVGTTNTEGAYDFSLRPNRSKDYRVVVPSEGACEKARSRIITVRVNR